jgi:predicted DNA-binding transcriptional regulator AlpA
MMNDQLLTRAQSAELAGVDPRTVDRWANEGRIERLKVGGLQWVRFRRSEILAMVSAEPEDGPCEHESWEVQEDGSGICNDCGEEAGGIGANEDPFDGDDTEVDGVPSGK